MLSSDQNTLAGTHSQHSTSQDDVAGVEEANPGFPAVQLADAQVGGGLHPVPCAWSPRGKGEPWESARAHHSANSASEGVHVLARNEEGLAQDEKEG